MLSVLSHAVRCSAHVTPPPWRDCIRRSTPRICSSGTTGGYEGRTTAQIRADEEDPDWVIWNAHIPPGGTPGEQPADVAERCRRVLSACQPFLDADQDVALVAHGHVLRILTATWLGLAARDGRLFTLGTGTLSKLGFEHAQQVIDVWNAPNP